MNTEPIPKALSPADSRTVPPARDYPSEPVRSQWVVDLASHRVIRQETGRPSQPSRGGRRAL
ncbi:MAG: hypothetical protein KJ048_09625 [Dehalococcoidia bacterium]|nr:hypothetical protein [Dehalococcoidia bacterium]